LRKRKEKKKKMLDVPSETLEVYSLSCNVTLGLWKLHWPNSGQWKSSNYKRKKKGLDFTFWYSNAPVQGPYLPVMNIKLIIIFTMMGPLLEECPTMGPLPWI
jgi:hypothetical protein